MMTSAILVSFLAVAMLTRSTMRARRARVWQDGRKAYQVRKWTDAVKY